MVIAALLVIQSKLTDSAQDQQVRTVVESFLQAHPPESVEIQKMCKVFRIQKHYQSNKKKLAWALSSTMSNIEQIIELALLTDGWEEKHGLPPPPMIGGGRRWRFW